MLENQNSNSCCLTHSLPLFFNLQHSPPKLAALSSSVGNEDEGERGRRHQERRSSSSSCETLSGENVVIAPSVYLNENGDSNDAFGPRHGARPQHLHPQQPTPPLHPGYPLDTPTISPESPVVSPGKSGSSAAGAKQQRKSSKPTPKEVAARLNHSTPSSPAMNAKGKIIVL